MPQRRFCLQIVLSLSFLGFAGQAFGQAGALDVGLRAQKTLNLYLENGLTAQYRLSRRVGVGLSYVSSRLGSALGSNAIKQDNVLASAAWLFRPDRSLNPYVQANIGWFSADYEADIFRNLPHTSPLVSLEGGLRSPIKGPVGASASVGYNLITGNGLDGPGTLFPLFYQLSVTYRLKTPGQK